MKTKAKIVCHAGTDYNVTAAKLLVMAGQLIADATSDAPVASKEAATAFVDGVISAAVSGGYTKPEVLRAALSSSQRSNRLAVMAHEACKAAGREALANLIGGVPG
jgi:hypothetical protein